jgi:hypothetical protein
MFPFFIRETWTVDHKLISLVHILRSADVVKHFVPRTSPGHQFLSEADFCCHHVLLVTKVTKSYLCVCVCVGGWVGGWVGGNAEFV